MQFGATKGQFGQTKRGASIPWRNIPARPFLGLSPTDETEIVATVEEYLSGALARHG
jgi:phage gpG-like protein